MVTSINYGIFRSYRANNKCNYCKIRLRPFHDFKHNYQQQARDILSCTQNVKCSFHSRRIKFISTQPRSTHTMQRDQSESPRASIRLLMVITPVASRAVKYSSRSPCLTMRPAIIRTYSAVNIITRESYTALGWSFLHPPTHSRGTNENPW